MKVLLVDDEIFTIRMLQNVIHWKEMALEVSGYAGSGEEAYEKVVKDRPDIVISDIRMHGMSGIELLKKIHMYDPGIRVILMSAYADFSYAHEALKAGCSDYILKPIDEVEMEHALRKVTAEIQGAKEQEKKLSQSEDRLFEMNLYQYMRTGMGKNKVLNFGQKFKAQGFQIFFIRLDSNTIDEYDSSYNIEMGNARYIRKILEQIVQTGEEQSFIFDYEEESWTVIWGEQEGEKPEELAARILERLKNEVGVSVTVSFSSEGKTLEELPELYGEAVGLEKYSFYIGDVKILGYGYNCSPKEMEKIRSIGSFRDITQAVKLGNKENMAAVLNEVLQSGKRGSDKAYARECCGHMIAEIEKHYGEKAAALVDRAQAQLAECSTVKGMKECCLKLLHDIPKADGEKNSQYSRQVSDSIRMIEEQYNRNLSLEEICNQVSVSKNYFCYLFKRETGMSLWNYLTEVRLRHARELLRHTDMKSYEIAFAVGYENPSYFAKTFKRYEQMTPNEYRESVI